MFLLERAPEEAGARRARSRGIRLLRDRIEVVNTRCAALVSRVIHEDAGLDDDESMLLAVGLIGVAQVTARYWAASGSRVPRGEATRLVAALSWRGIGGFPRATD